MLRPMDPMIRLDPSAFDRQLFVEQLVRVLNHPRYQPPVLPNVALSLLSMSKRSDVSVKELAEQIEQDPILAASVLRVASSAAYARAGTIRTLPEAIVRLGSQTISDLFFQVWSTARVFRAPGYEEPMSRLRRHSVATATLARFVAERAELEADHVFLCGLFHDVGLAVSLLGLCDGRKPSELPRYEDVAPVLHEVHESMGALLCRLWRLPPAVRAVVEHHHSLTAVGDERKVAAVVIVAESIALRAGLGHAHDVEDVGELSLALEALALSSESLETLALEAAPLVSSLA